MKKPILLDTHVWVWLMLGDSRLGPRSRRMLEEAVPRNRLLISPISVWEVAMLEAKGRLFLTGDCLNWVQRALAAPGIQLVELTPKIAVAATRLSPPFHGDPADRIIVATALETGAVLITADQAIQKYGRRGRLSVVSA